MNKVRSAWRARGVAAVGAMTCAALVASPLAANAADEETPRWTYEVATHETGVNNGYQLAFDETNGKVYFTDAKWRSETRADGTLEGEPLDWSSLAADATSHSSMRTTFSPYGIAVDGTLDGGTIVTTTARATDAAAGGAAFGGAVVIYPASQGAPTDADRVFDFADGTPVFSGVRRIAVDENTHRAFVTNLGTSRGGRGGPEGFIAVLDLTKKGAESVLARVTIPGAVGAVGVEVDQENNLIYVGSMVGEKLYVIDGNAIDVSDPKNLELNDGAVRELPAVVGANARPTYSPELKRLYVSAYAAPEATITVVDADPASATYGEAIDSVVTGPTNAVAVDGARGLLYSANLGDQQVVVFDALTLEQLLEVPTSGNAVNLGVDPLTHRVWVSNFSNSGKTDVITVLDNAPAVDPEPTPDPEPGAQTPGTSGEGSASGLAATGEGAPLVIGGIAALALLLGAGILLMQYRRRSAE